MWSLTLKDLEYRAFSRRVIDATSYAYRIEACILLREVLALTRTADSCPQTYKMLDAKIPGWFYHLPGSDRGQISPDRESNEIIIQAIMLFHCASISLSLPRSPVFPSSRIMETLICGSVGKMTSAYPSLIYTPTRQRKLRLEFQNCRVYQFQLLTIPLSTLVFSS